MGDFFSKNSIFADSPAMGEVDTMHEKQQDDCYVAERYCERCFEKRRVEIEWAELYCVAHAVFPQQFQYSDWGYSKEHGKMYPNVQCNCGALVFIPFTAASARKLVQSAIESNNISQEQLQKVNQLRAAFQQQQQRR